MRKKIVLICIFLVFLVSCKISNVKKEVHVVQHGVYDINNLDSAEVVELKGNWLFIPNKFVDPKSNFSEYRRTEILNCSWTQYQDPMPSFGYATYSIKINNFSKDAVYAMRIGETSSAITAYLNGEEFFRAGMAADSKEKEVFDWNSSVVILPLNGSKEARIVFHISNFRDKRPGIHPPIQIGFYSALLKENNKNIVVATITAGILLILSIFFISLYIFYTKEKKSLYFGLLCFVFSLRTFCYEDFLLTTIIPQMHRLTMHKLGFITLSFAIISASLFVHEIFGRINKKILYVMLFPVFVYGLINLTMPFYISISLRLYAQIYLIILLGYNIAVLVCAALRKNISAVLFLAAILVGLFLVVKDILIANGMAEGTFLSQFGVLVLLIPITMIVLNHFKFTVENILAITKKIEVVNNALTKFLPNEFMNFLHKKHIHVCLGDSGIKYMYVAFVYVGLNAELKISKNRSDILKLYNRMLANINPVIRKYGGFIDKYLTEGLMILFTSSACDVINCMLELENFIKTENEERSILNSPAINFACGVHYGEVMFGTIGETERMDNTVISDVVNVASRLHLYALNKRRTIFISGVVKDKFTFSAVQNIIFKDAGLVKLRGKDKPIEVYEVERYE